MGAEEEKTINEIEIKLEKKRVKTITKEEREYFRQSLKSEKEEYEKCKRIVEKMRKMW
jgi:hypothetical protein